jgi:hypothetical protein
MKRIFPWRGPRFLNRRLGRALCKGLLLGLSLMMFLAGLRLIPIEDTRRFLAEHAGLFLAWRILLYGGIGWGGWRVYRLRQAAFEPTSEFRRRWRRIGIAMLGTVVLLELNQLSQ